MVCNPTSGHLYLSYTFYTSGSASSIYFVSNTGSGWSSPILLSNGNGVGSRTVIGPDGEIYVFWENFSTSLIEGRRSDDDGLTFGPVFTVGATRDNFSPSPATHHTGFANPAFACNHVESPSLPSIAIDRSLGAHRGTIYAVWTDRVEGEKLPVTTSVGEREPNGSAAAAQEIRIGQEFSGVATSADVGDADTDVYFFDGVAGQTIWMEGTVTGVSPGVAGEFCHGFSLFHSGFETEFTSASLTHTLFARIGRSSPLVYTLPSSGRYYICLHSGGRWSIGYRIRIQELIPGGTEPARDHRDIVLTSSSDGGATWSPKVLVNDDPPMFDNYLPEVAVDGVGRVHVTWYDRRDDPINGDDYNVYWTQSDDGGATFQPSVRMSDTTSVRDRNQIELGDHMALEPTRTGVYSLWAQGRLTPAFQSNGVDHDIHIRHVDVVPEIRATDFKVSSEVRTHGRGPRRLKLAWTVQEPAFVVRFDVHRSRAAGGPYEAMGSVQGTDLQDGHYSHFDDDVRPNEVFFYRIDSIRTDGERITGDPVRIEVPARPVGVAILSVTPNPSTGAILLNIETGSSERTVVRVFDARGALVRELLGSTTDSGFIEMTWDGHDNHGKSVSNGLYFIEARSGQDVDRRKVIRVSK